ncbi:MAG: ATP-binding protein [Acidothermaceae bacterium]
MSERPAPDHRTRLLLPAGADSVARARHFARDAAAALGLDCDTLALVTSELVTNAVRYSSGEIELTVTPRGGHLRIEVRDNSPELPTVRRASSSERSGRGLAIVEEIAARWWVRQNADGTKTVGAEVACRPTAAT